MEKNFFYDSFSDRLLVSCKKEGDRIAGSIKILNVTLDITTDNRIVNVEIKRTSEFLSTLKINPAMLDNLKKARLVVRRYNNGYLIYFFLETNKVTERIPFNIPIKTSSVLA